MSGRKGRNCSEVKTGEGKDGKEEIEADFMRGNKEVECIYIPDSVRIISSEDFARCVNLKYVRMSRNIKEIHTAAFEFTISLSKLSFSLKSKLYQREHSC